MSTFDPHYVAQSLALSAERFAAVVPAQYADARVTVPEVARWVAELVAGAQERANPNLGPTLVKGSTGPSLLLLGPTGTGKTFEAWGAIRALTESGVRATRWEHTTAADLYARMRPRHGVDAEEVFEVHAHAPVLVLDDIGAAKASEWTEEVNYRLINHRYQHRLPTLITSNIPAAQLREDLGLRVASRLREMAYRVVLAGADRREPARWGSVRPRPTVAPVEDGGLLGVTEAGRRLAAVVGGAFAMGLQREREPADPNQRAEYMQAIRAELGVVRTGEPPVDEPAEPPPVPHPSRVETARTATENEEQA